MASRNKEDPPFPQERIKTGIKPCPLCGKMLKWLPQRCIVWGEWGRNWFGEAWTSWGVEPHEFYVWIDHNFPMKDEIKLVRDDGMGGFTGGIPINRKLWLELQDDPKVSYRDLDSGYLEHDETRCKPKGNPKTVGKSVREIVESAVHEMEHRPSWK